MLTLTRTLALIPTRYPVLGFSPVKPGLTLTLPLTLSLPCD